MNARTIAKQLAQKGHRTLGQKLIKAEGPRWQDASRFAKELATTATQLAKLLEDEEEGKAYKHLYAAVTDVASIVEQMAYAEVQPRATKMLLKVRDEFKKRFNR